MTNHEIAEECRESIKLARLGYLLASGQLDHRAANDIIYEVQQTAGWFPLEVVEIASVRELAEDIWGERPELADLAARACRRVWNTWESVGGATDAAQDWAIDLISEYAEHDGIELKRVDGEEG